MSSDSNTRDIGILFRDFGFLPLSDAAGFRKIEVKIDHALQRKGTNNYAIALAKQIKEWRPDWFDTIIVIGDGEGDVRLCTNVANLLNESYPLKKVIGLFIQHAALEKYYDGGDSFFFYETWESLSIALERMLAELKENDDNLSRTLVFVDVDRTILFPRSICDESYFSCRMDGVVEYILSFRLNDGDSRFERQIGQYIDLVSTRFEEYTKNELNALCFKNEETVAVVTLLLCVGTILKKWIGSSVRHRDLSWMLRHSVQKLEHGGWISGLDLEKVDGIAGDLYWDRAALIRHFKSVLLRMAQHKPVLCPEFRECEAKQLNGIMSARGLEIFNLSLLSTLRSLMPFPTLFLTDRPAQSLGVVREELGDDRGGGPFWTTLKAYLATIEDSSNLTT